MSIEDSGKEFADQLCTTLERTGITTQLDDPQKAFSSGCYFGAVQGYKRGINAMLVEAINYLPEIYSEIVDSNFDMSINWQERYKQLLLKKVFGIETK